MLKGVRITEYRRRRRVCGHFWLPACARFRTNKDVSGFTSAAARCFDGGDVDLLHRHHGPKARLASAPPAASASVSARGVICQKRPQRSLHQPHWLSAPPLPTIAFQ
jgi:hypothetical protein